MADISISERMMQALRDYAAKTGQAVEQVADQAIQQFLDKQGDSKLAPAENPLGDALLALSGAGRSGQSDVSERTNEILRDEVDPERGWTFNRDRTD